MRIFALKVLDVVKKASKFELHSKKYKIISKLPTTNVSISIYRDVLFRCCISQIHEHRSTHERTERPEIFEFKSDQNLNIFVSFSHLKYNNYRIIFGAFYMKCYLIFLPEINSRNIFYGTGTVFWTLRNCGRGQ